MISKNKPTKGKIGTPYHIEKSYQGKKSCASCIYYEKDDSSCSLKPIVINEVGFNYYKNCKDFEMRQDKEDKNRTGRYNNEKIARVVRSSISNGANLKEVAKSFNLSLYKALVIYNNIYGDFRPMNENNINRLRNYGLSNKKIAEFYDVNEEIIFNKPQTKKQVKKDKDNNTNAHSHKVKENSENASIVIKVSKGICDLCNKKSKDVSIYYIDNNRNADINSILNMVILCKNCRKEVNRDKDSHYKKLKEIAIEKMDKIMELA